MLVALRAGLALGLALDLASCSRSTQSEQAAVSAFMAVTPPPPVPEPSFAPQLAPRAPPEPAPMSPDTAAPRPVEPFRPSSRCAPVEPVGKGQAGQEQEGWPLGEPTWAADMPYAQALKQSKTYAREEGLTLQKSLKLEAGKASVEVYSKQAEDESYRVLLDIVAAGYQPWSIEGVDGTTAVGRLLPNGEKGPRLAELNIGACPFQCLGCSPATWGFTIFVQWYGGELSVVPLANPALGDFADVDGDGLLELRLTETRVPLDGCEARWCCGVRQLFGVETYLGWQDGCWRRDLPRFARVYAQALGQERAQLDALRKQGVQSADARCESARSATSVYLLEVLLGGDAERQRRQWGAELGAFSPLDCYPETSLQGDLRSMVASADDVRLGVLGVTPEPLPAVAAAASVLPAPAASSAPATSSAPSASGTPSASARVAPTLSAVPSIAPSAAQRVPLP